MEQKRTVRKGDVAKIHPRWRLFAVAALVFAAAFIMGLPTLRGSFVGGDDHRLVLNHVLVNHPSPAHALELFAIVHRDLYQPLPLLSFSAEFAVGGALGLFDEGIARGAWLFHLTNVMLHATNAVLVWVVILLLMRRREGDVSEDSPGDAVSAGGTALAVATVAATLFAVHPLQVEVVAWVNGRMMLLSTLFGLASLVALAVWQGTGRHRWAVLTAAFVLCCAISKIRVGLPLLLLIVPLAQRRKPTRAFLVVWLVCTAITAVFAWVNYSATAQAGMFEGAVANLHGPRVIRALLAMAWYFQHFVWPTGLASWYPTPGLVTWSDPATVRAIVVVLAVFAVIAWSALRRRVVALGFAWFAVTIASTVQLVPTRNALAADRYMYLPIIGLLWLVSAALVGGYVGASRRWALRRLWAIVAPACAAVIIAMIAVSWHTASFYETPVKKSMRIAQLAPTTSHVWERAAWAHHREGLHEEAIALAQREFEHDDANAQGVAYQVIGMSQLELGRHDNAVVSLKRALELDPKSPTAKHRLGLAWYELGRVDDALMLFEQAIADAPLKNPWIIHLASKYREFGRSGDARTLYKQALRNNPYEVPAILGLAELDIAARTHHAYLAAEQRLLSLLEWMPENTAARVNLGVVYHALERVKEAVEAYREVLDRNPADATAALNLAQIYNGTGETARAATLFETAVAAGLESVAQLAAVHDFFISRQAPQRAVDVWAAFVARYPDSPDGRAFLAWSHALAGSLPRARGEAEALAAETPHHPLALATLAYVALVSDHFEVATGRADSLCATGSLGADARRRLLLALGGVVQKRPDLAWTFCLAAQLWIADGQFDNARAFIELCEQQCEDAVCSQQAQALRTRVSAVAPPPTGS